ncbi:hypothetical protein BDQ17DRAFT_1437559 [Cyathus striatus]|nr:hypothetical protein BDQ17DRAFT_1437559 [Cyathus striatus]
MPASHTNARTHRRSSLVPNMEVYSPILAPEAVTPTPVMFDSTWSFEHPQQQFENDIYVQQGYIGYDGEYDGQDIEADREWRT